MEEWLLYFMLAGTGVVVLFIVKFLSNSTKRGEEVERDIQPRENVRAGQGNRRIAAVRNRRAPARRVADESDSDGGAQGGGDGQADISDSEEAILNDPKLGAKKRAKLEAKIEKRAQREAEERQRVEKKIRDEKDDVEKKKKDAEEEEEEKRKLEEEKRLREEAAQRELEEYQKMKAAFIVEDEGCDVIDDEEEINLLDKFVTHIKDKKVILFEELATRFNLKVPEAIDRLNRLVESGRLTGVLDDRGKFVYISEEELAQFAKFIRQRGRVSIVDLIENSNQIINLTPDTVEP